MPYVLCGMLIDLFLPNIKFFSVNKDFMFLTVYLLQYAVDCTQQTVNSTVVCTPQCTNSYYNGYLL